MDGDSKDIFLQYAEQISSVMRSVDRFAPLPGEGPLTIRVERGVAHAFALKDTASVLIPELMNRIADEATIGRIADIRVVDAANHSRSAYRPLMIYSAKRALQVLERSSPSATYARWETALQAWCEVIEADVQSFLERLGTPTAQDGARWAEMAWNTLALQVPIRGFIRVKSQSVLTEVITRLIFHQEQNGAFLTTTPSDQPETWWYHELQILQAIATFAGHANNGAFATSVHRASAFHMNETQPDHATTQPWGLLAFIWNTQTRPLADEMLHTVRLQQTSAIDGVSLMLLADCLYCLRRMIAWNRF